MIQLAPYPEWFQDFWKQALALRTRTLGSKPDAYKAAKTLKMDADDVDMVITSFREHTEQIRDYQRGKGEFIADHSDMCRWLKQRRWEESHELMVIDGQADESKIQSKFDQLADRSWAT